MLSVVIATHESERELLPTLAALVPGAAAGAVREVIVADAGSRDQTAEVADIAGCRVIVSPAPLGARLEERRGGGARAVADVPAGPASYPTRPGSRTPSASSSRSGAALPAQPCSVRRRRKDARGALAQALALLRMKFAGHGPNRAS